jgi:hypothetical protein
MLAFRWRRVDEDAGFAVGEARRVEFVLEETPEGTRLLLTEEPWPIGQAGARERVGGTA